MITQLRVSLPPGRPIYVQEGFNQHYEIIVTNMSDGLTSLTINGLHERIILRPSDMLKIEVITGHRQ